MERTDSVVTELLDLSAVALGDLRSISDDLLRASRDRVLEQVQRLRVNLGSSGPPGRAD